MIKKNIPLGSKLTLVKGSRTKKKAHSESSSMSSRVKDRKDTYKTLFLFFMVICLTLLLSPDMRRQLLTLHIGDIALKDIKSAKEYLIQDNISTEKNKKEASDSQLPIYDFDNNLGIEIIKNIETAFSEINADYLSDVPNFSYNEQKEEIETEVMAEQENDIVDQELIKKQKEELRQNIILFESNDLFKEREQKFLSTLGISLSEKSLKTLKWHKYKPEIKHILINFIKHTMSKGVMTDKHLLSADRKDKIITRFLGIDREDTVPISSIFDISQAIVYLNELIEKHIEKKHPSLKKVVKEMGKLLIRPNLTFNKKETEEARISSVKSVKPVFFQIKKGEMIVREGERINREHIIKIEGMRDENEEKSGITVPLGIALFISLLFYLSWFYLRKFKRHVLSDLNSFMLLGTILILNFAVVRTFIFTSQAFAEYTDMNIISFYYALPFAAGTMLTAILFDIDISILFCIVTFFLVNILMDSDKSYYPLVALTGGMVAALRVSYYKHRSAILYTGIMIGIMNIFTIIPITIINNTLFSEVGLHNLFMGFAGGLITAVAASVLLPIVESLFKVTSDIRLLELADPNHPLLTQMVIHAPGTYQHSHLVANLSEEAAESVDAHPLLVRVGSYFHDIGKMKKPDYFIENQQIASNSKHDKLTPNMSSLVLLSHVKDGIELAKEYKLIPSIIQFIREHHGNSLITYFYNKAKEQGQDNTNLIKEEDFRYPGPRPHSKEVAIVMLADSVEAASRTLDEPTPSRISGLVHNIINNKFIDGQLDECNLSIKDLSKIEKSFTRILLGIFHYRVDYPLQDDKESIYKNGVKHIGPKQSEKAEGKYPKGKKNSKNNMY